MNSDWSGLHTPRPEVKGGVCASRSWRTAKSEVGSRGRRGGVGRRKKFLFKKACAAPGQTKQCVCLLHRQEPPGPPEATVSVTCLESA